MNQLEQERKIDELKANLNNAMGHSVPCSLVCGAAVKLQVLETGFFCMCEERVDNILRDEMMQRVSRIVKAASRSFIFQEAP